MAGSMLLAVAAASITHYYCLSSRVGKCISGPGDDFGHIFRALLRQCKRNDRHSRLGSRLLPLRLGSRFFCRLLEQFRIDCGIELERRVLGSAGILAVLLVVAHEGNCHAVYRLPVVQVGFAQGWAALAERGISLFQDVTVLWIDKPTDRGARGVHVDDAGFDVADLLSSIG